VLWVELADLEVGWNELDDVADDEVLRVGGGHLLRNEETNLLTNVGTRWSEATESDQGVLVSVGPNVGDWELVGELQSVVLGKGVASWNETLSIRELLDH
jgi:hypothetical protein